MVLLLLSTNEKVDEVRGLQGTAKGRGGEEEVGFGSGRIPRCKGKKVNGR